MYSVNTDVIISDKDSGYLSLRNFRTQSTQFFWISNLDPIKFG